MGSERRSIPGGELARAVIVAMLLVQSEADASAAQRPGDVAPDAWVLALPTRRVPDAPPGAPPSLPPGAERITPLTIEAIVRRQPSSGSAQTLPQTISRTADRIHIAADSRREWLFERNPRDPRRVSAALIEHTSQAIVLYEESDLRMMLGIRGWADVLALGSESELLTVARTRAGVDASRLRPPDHRFPKYRVYDLASWLERQ